MDAGREIGVRIVQVIKRIISKRLVKFIPDETVLCRLFKYFYFLIYRAGKVYIFFIF